VGACLTVRQAPQDTINGSQRRHRIMSDNVYISGQNADNAVLLLAAAEELEQDASVVATVDGGFSVPVDVAAKAGFDEDGRPKRAAAKKAAAAPDTAEGEAALVPANEAAEKAPAKKAPARRPRAKKAAAPADSGKE
jgi:trigger factor